MLALMWRTYAKYFGTSVCVKPTPLNKLYVDNTGAEMLAKERKVTSRSRHITRPSLSQSAGVRG
eukprot:scaffold13141_cov105-Isochrysis_galbana.AAC.3